MRRARNDGNPVNKTTSSGLLTSLAIVRADAREPRAVVALVILRIAERALTEERVADARRALDVRLALTLRDLLLALRDGILRTLRAALIFAIGDASGVVVAARRHERADAIEDAGARLKIELERRETRRARRVDLRLGREERLARRRRKSRRACGVGVREIARLTRALLHGERRRRDVRWAARVRRRARVLLRFARAWCRERVARRSLLRAVDARRAVRAAARIDEAREARPLLAATRTRLRGARRRARSAGARLLVLRAVGARETAQSTLRVALARDARAVRAASFRARLRSARRWRSFALTRCAVTEKILCAAVGAREAARSALRVALRADARRPGATSFAVVRSARRGDARLRVRVALLARLRAVYTFISGRPARERRHTRHARELSVEERAATRRTARHVARRLLGDARLHLRIAKLETFGDAVVASRAAESARVEIASRAAGPRAVAASLRARRGSARAAVGVRAVDCAVASVNVRREVGASAARYDDEGNEDRDEQRSQPSSVSHDFIVAP